MAGVMDLIKQKKQELASKSGRNKAEKPQSGKHRYRFLPSWRNNGDLEEQWFMDFGQHFIKDDDPNKPGQDKIMAVYNCDSIIHGTTCDVCTALTTAVMSGDMDDGTIKRLKEAEAKGAVIFNALHLTGEDKKKPIVLQLTATTAEKLFSIAIEYDDEDINIVDLEDGIDIIIEKKGTGLETRYEVMAAAKSKPVDKSVLAELNDLDEFVNETDESKKKAISAIAVSSGVAALAGGTTSGALTDGRKSKDVPMDTDIDLDDEIPDDFDTAAEDPDVDDDGLDADYEPAAAADTSTDDDIDSLLDDL